MLSPCGVPAGMEGKVRREGEQELSPQSSENVKQPKQNVRAGNCEQTAERVRGGVPVLWKYGECECQGGGGECSSPMLQINHIYQADRRMRHEIRL